MSTENSLIFGNPMTVATAKSDQGVDALFIRDAGNGQFFTCGALRGPVSKKFDVAKPALISECTDPSSGEQFMLLHNESEAKVVATL